MLSSASLHSGGLFPAHAGVIIEGLADLLCEEAVPRTRGGDPQILAAEKAALDCSPHTRG